MALGSIVVDLLMRTGSFETDTKRAEKRLEEFRKKAVALGTALGTAAAAGATALAALTAQAINYADQINDMSQKVGVSTETLSGWAYAAGQAGTSVEALASALPKLSKNIAAAADESSKQAELFGALGIKVRDAAGELRSAEEILPELADRFKALDNETTETALAMELFGKSGAEMLQFLNEGSDGLAELVERARELGVVINSETAAAAGEFNDKLDDLKALAMALGLQIAERLLPDLIELTQELTDLVKEGEAAAEVADVIGTAFEIFDGTIRVVTSTVRGITFDLIAMANALLAVNKASRLDFSGAKESWEAAKVAREMAAQESADIDRVFAGGQSGAGKPEIVIRDGLDYLADKEAEAREKALQARIDALLTGGNKPSRAPRSAGSRAKSGPTEEEKAWQEWVEEMADVESAWAAAKADVEQRTIDQHNSTLDMLDMLAEEQALLSMTADEQEIYNNLKWAGVDAQSEFGKEITAATEELQRQRDAMEDQIDMMDSVRDAGRGLWEDLKDGVSLWDAIGNAVQRVVDSLVDKGLEAAIDGLFGKQGDSGGGSWGDAIGSFFGSIFGGAKANGGDVFSDRAYLIGEQGPEMFVPRTAGTILSAGHTASLVGRGAGGNFMQNVNVTIAGRPDRRTPEQIARAAGRETQRAMSRTGR